MLRSVISLGSRNGTFWVLKHEALNNTNTRYKLSGVKGDFLDTQSEMLQLVNSKQRNNMGGGMSTSTK